MIAAQSRANHQDVHCGFRGVSGLQGATERATAGSEQATARAIEGYSGLRKGYSGLQRAWNLAADAVDFRVGEKFAVLVELERRRHARLVIRDPDHVALETGTPAL